MAGIDKRVTCHTLRHSFAATMLDNGINIRMLQAYARLSPDAPR